MSPIPQRPQSSRAKFFRKVLTPRSTGSSTRTSVRILALVLTYALFLQFMPFRAMAALNNRAASRKRPGSSATEQPSKFSQVSGEISSVPNAPLPDPPSINNSVTDAVVSRHKPTLNSGRIDGTLRVLLPESFAINGSTQITSDLFLPGSPAITTNGGSQYGGTASDNGSAAPSNYTLTLSGGVSLAGKIHTQVDAIQLPDFPSSVPSAAGTRAVSVTSQSATANIGNWQTVRDLNVTGAHITIDVPPGNYGTFTVNGNSQLKFSAGTYNFANTFNLDGSATVQATGLVTINVGQNLIINSGAVVLGSYTSPGDLNVNVLGATVNVNGSSQVTGLLHAYNANVTVSGTAQIRGQLIANTLTLNGSGKVIGAVWPANSTACPTIFGPRRFDRTTGPPNQYVEQFSLPSGFNSPFTLHIQNGSLDGTQRVSSATIKLNGVDVLSPSDLNQNVASIDRSVNLAANNQLEVRLASAPGSYLIIKLCGTTSITDTTAPLLAISSPQNNFPTFDSAITVSGTATDNGAGATGVAHVYVNDMEASYNSAAGTWTIANLALQLGDNQIVVRAVDQVGNQSTASIKAIRQSPVNNAPTADAGTDQTLSLPNTATLHGTASDDGQPAGSTLTTTWSKVSGPGTVTFGDAAALNTTATFSESGSYVLLLTASDGVLSKTDDVTITVQPQNQPPTVSAGPNQTIALPNTATLNGTVTDDGLPAGNTVTTQWTRVSGPGTVTFEDATLTDTSATFSEAGPYVLRLTASDGDQSAKSDVTITVQPENHAPVVNAGQSRTVSLPDGATQLNGSATDDGLPAGSSLTVSWGMQLGPATPIFDNPNSPITTVHFTVAGTYTLRLTATDGELTSTADVNITVTPPNQAPSVNAGADQSIALAGGANLSGTVTDDGLPLGSSVSTLWTQVSGPGAVTFANPNVTVTTASFSAAGTYVLRLTGSDSQLASSDDVVITVNQANQAPVADFGLAANKGPVALTTVSFSSYRNDGFETYHPKQLLDTTVNTYWWSADGQVSNQSMVFRTADGQAALIDRVRLQNPFVDGTDVRQFEVQVSSATANASDFHSVLIGSMPDNPTPMEFVFPDGPVTAKFIKLVVVNNYGSSVSTILGTFQPVSAGGFDSIVSFLGKPNSASNQSPALIQNGGAIYDFSYGGGTNTADQMLGYARGGWITTTTTNEFAIIQLGGNKPSTIDGVKIATGYDFGFGRPTAVKDFEVWVSSTTTEASAFTKVLAASVDFNPQLQTFVFPGGPVQARYVKYVPLNNQGGGAQINTPIFDVIAEGTARVVAASSQDNSQLNPPEEAFDDSIFSYWFSPNGVVTDVWVKTVAGR
jgi:hypothetical protein